MRKLLLLTILILTFNSCKKTDPNTQYCYECNLDNTGYKDVGCYTITDWNNMQFTDQNGNAIDKSSKCRKK